MLAFLARWVGFREAWPIESVGKMGPRPPWSLSRRHRWGTMYYGPWAWLLPRSPLVGIRVVVASIVVVDKAKNSARLSQVRRLTANMLRHVGPTLTWDWIFKQDKNCGTSCVTSCVVRPIAIL